MLKGLYMKGRSMRRKRKVIISLFTIILFFIVSSYSFAEKKIRYIISEKFSEKRDICLVTKVMIQEGMDTKETVRTITEMGYGACLIIRCAIEGGGKLEEIINGAIKAGATSDVISRCSIDAGAKPKDVARILEQSPAMISVGLPAGDRGGGRSEEKTLSPFTP